MPLIDWHTHLWNVDEHLTISAERQLNKIGEYDLDARVHRHVVDVGAQTDGFVLVGSYWPKIGITVPNEDLAAYAASSNHRCYSLASIDPSRSGAGAEAERAIRDLKMDGFKLAPTYQFFHPWAKEAYEVYEVAKTYDVPIMFHQGAAFPAESELEDARPALLDKPIRDFPEVTFIIAHLGQPWMEETIQLMRKHPNVWTDLSARYIRPWQLFNGIEVATEYGVTDRMLFGSDFPTQTPRAAESAFLAARDELVPRYFRSSLGEVVEPILYDRPLSLVFRDQAVQPVDRRERIDLGHGGRTATSSRAKT